MESVCSEDLTEKWGTCSDRALLPAQTAWSKAHKNTQTFVIHGDGWVDGMISMNKIPPMMVARWAVEEDVAAAFEDEFSSVQ